MAFLKDPKGPPLWEEDPGAKDVVHIDSEKVTYSPLVLVGARASWYLGVPRRGLVGTSEPLCPLLHPNETRTPLFDAQFWPRTTANRLLDDDLRSLRSPLPRLICLKCSDVP